jgi:ATP-dependent exoDNAse (exonuclease V) beta subunit
MSDIHWQLLKQTAGLEFDEPTHKYTYQGEAMESVTTVLKSLSAPFDADHHAARIAERDGTTTEAVLADWKVKADTASTQGDYVHNHAERLAWDLDQYKELIIKVKSHPDEYRPKLHALWRWFTDRIELANGFLFPELKVVWPEYRIAGTVDLVASNFDGVRSIVDYKTNKSIDISGYRNMLPPFQRGKLKLEDSNFWGYSLQLNMYRRIMLERYDYEAERLVLVHLTNAGKYVEYDVPILDAHIDKILEKRDGC